VPAPRTSRPGRNFRLAGFGVASVWMNMIGRLSRGRGRELAVQTEI
jgi:hypothetical protein